MFGKGSSMCRASRTSEQRAAHEPCGALSKLHTLERVVTRLWDADVEAAIKGVAEGLPNDDTLDSRHKVDSLLGFCAAAPAVTGASGVGAWRVRQL